MAVKTKSSERRKHVRAKRALTIDHRLYKRKGKIVDGSWRSSTTENMSLVGILFLSDIPYLIGDILEARVAMSGLDIFRGFGRVVRGEEKKTGNLYSIALVFMDEKSQYLRFRES